MPEAVRIAGNDDAILRQEDERERSFELQQCVAEGSREGAFRRVRDEVEDDFGIARCLEDRAAIFEVLAQLGGVRNIAVVRDRNLAFVAGDGKRLRVAERRVTRSRVPRMTDGAVAGETRQDFGRKDVCHVPH